MPIKNLMPFSASRIANWMRCNRLGAWEKIAGYETPGTDATDLGGDVHNILEWYKKNEHLGVAIDRMTDAGALAAEAIPFVADMSLEDGASIEGEFTFRGRHTWRGKIDIEKPGDLRDYKTTSHFKWKKTPEELQHDPQAVLYAERMFRRMENAAPLPDDATLKGTWLYIRKAKPIKCEPVTFTMTRGHARKMFEVLETFADDMQTAASNAPDDPAGKHKYILDVIEPNPDACWDYGRPCPHQARCNISFFRDPSTAGKKPMNPLLARLEAQNAFNGPANTTAAPVAATPAPVGNNGYEPTRIDIPEAPAVAPASPPPYVPAGGPSRLRALEALSAGAPALGPAPVTVVTPSGPTTFSAEFMATEVAPGQVNPPKRKPGRPRKVASVPPPSVQISRAAELAQPTVPPAAVSVAPAEQIPAPGGSPSAELTGTVNTNPTRMEVAPPPAPAKHRIDTLYVGCIPSVSIGCDPRPNFDNLVAKAKVAIGPQDYRLYEYGKGNGMLLSMFEAIVQHEKPTALVVISPMSPEAVLCLSHLRSISDTVVEAVR